MVVIVIPLVGNRCVPSQLSTHTVDIIKSLDAAYTNKTADEKFNTILKSMKHIIRFAYWQQVTPEPVVARVYSRGYSRRCLLAR